jgi:hypothetical protein
VSPDRRSHRREREVSVFCDHLEIRAVNGGEPLSDEEIERELLRIARSRTRSQLQPRVAALRAMLKRRREEREQEPEEPIYSWRNPALTVEQQLAWFELDLQHAMACERGWSILPREWHDGRSGRVRRLQREADAICAAVDRFAAFDEWRARVNGS